MLVLSTKNLKFYFSGGHMSHVTSSLNIFHPENRTNVQSCSKHIRHYSTEVVRMLHTVCNLALIKIAKDLKINPFC